MDSHSRTVFYSAVLSGAAFIMTTDEKTCSCFGHFDVDITEELTARTRTEIDRAIEDGVRIFIFGGRSDVDDLCYDLVTEQKNANPQLKICCRYGIIIKHVGGYDEYRANL